MGRLIFCAVLLATAAGCASPLPVDPQYLTIAIRQAPNGLDPRLTNDEASSRIGQLVFSPLVSIGDDLRVGPALAERLERSDPRTYVAYLRRGVRFHDGRELTSADVVYTFSAFLDPAFISPFKGAFRVLRSVRALDPHTVEFRLTEPFAAFPLQLEPIAIVPVGAGDEMKQHPIGTGPYRFVRYAVDDHVVLSAFADYYEGPPDNPGIVLKVVPDDTMRGLEIRKRSVDLAINDIPPDIVHQMGTRDRVRVVRSPGLDLSYLGFNMRDPVVGDRRVRHAIGYAIDRQAIVQHLRRGLATPAAGVIPPQAWAFEPSLFQFTFDPQKAKQLLDEAGYPDPDGDGPQPRLRLTLSCSSVEETRLQATVIQQDLARVGIALEVRSYEFATFYADVQAGNFQIFTLQWVGGALADPDILRRIFHSQQIPPDGFNRGYYSSREVDRLIDRASQAIDEDERKRYYGEAQRVIAVDAPYIPIWHRINAIVAQPTVTNLYLSATGNWVTLRLARKTGGT